MKKIAKLIIGLSVLTMLMVCMTTAAFAGTAEDKVTVKYRAAGVDKFYDLAPGLEVQGDLVEKNFPDVAQYEPEGVSFLDAIVASNIKVYGEEGFKDQLAIAKSAYGDFAWVDKAYGQAMLASISGKTYVNSVHDQIKDNDELAVLLYNDGDYNKTFSYFDKEEYTVAPGKPLEIAVTATSYGADYPVDDAVIVTIDTRDGLAFKEMETAFKDGKATVTFDKAGTYLISAKGKVTYDGGYGSATTDYLGAFAAVTVQYDGPVASITVPFKSSSIIKENEFDYADTGLKVTGDMSDKYGFDDTKDPSVVTFADVMIAAHAEKFEGEFVPLNAHNYMEFSDGGWFTKWFGVATSNVGYAFNRDFNMSGSAFDAVEDGTYIDVVEMTNFSSPLTYFDQDEVKTTVGEDVTLQLLGSSYGMKGEVIKPAEGKTLQVATVNKDGSLTDVEGATINEEGKVTLFFKGAGTYLVSAYGEGMSKDYMGEFVAARIGLPLTVVRVAEAKPAKPVIKTAKRVSKTKGTVTWKKAKNAKKYEVAYKMKGAKKWTTKKTAKLKITLKLKAKKAYQVKVRSINGSAKSAYSKTKTIKAK